MRFVPKFLRQMSVQYKLLGALVFLVIGLLLAAGTAAVLQLGAAQRAAILEAQHVATEIAAASDTQPPRDPAALQHYLESLGKLFNHDIFLVNAQGRIFASTNSAKLGSIYLNPEIATAMREGLPQAFIGPDISDPGDVRQVVVPLFAAGASSGKGNRGAVVFEYAQVYDTLMFEAKRAAALSGAATLAFALLGVLLATRVTRTLVKPLAELEAAATAIAAGDYTRRVKVHAHDEVGRLTVAFNRMSADLRRSRASLGHRNEALVHSNALLQAGIAREQEAKQRIEYLAYHDSLTGLANRTRFNQALSQAVAKAERNQKNFGLFFIDLDRFKQINDTLGHEVGDALLQEMAKRLRDALRTNDTIARLGGDEFVVLVEELRHDRHAEAVARKILRVVSKPFAVPGQELRITASVGISWYSRDGVDEQTLMKTADIALYQAKESGKNGFAFYSAERNTNSFERLALESSLRLALDRNELLLHYQPKQNFHTGRICGMEALLRWEHPDLGMVSPAQFIPVAEETGLIVPIGKWVLRQACMQTMQWRAQGLPDLVVAVNLSPRQFSDENLLNDIVKILHETGMDGRWLELEITESAIMQNAEAGRKLLSALKQHGIHIAIDDFGTGYSSLSTLKVFPVDTLKIDRSFTRDLTTNAEDRGLTEAIIQMAKTLNLQLVAEGVETDAQAAFLRERGCDELQGYFFSKPLPTSAFECFVVNHHMDIDMGAGLDRHAPMPAPHYVH